MFPRRGRLHPKPASFSFVTFAGPRSSRHQRFSRVPIATCPHATCSQEHPAVNRSPARELFALIALGTRQFFAHDHSQKPYTQNNLVRLQAAAPLCRGRRADGILLIREQDTVVFALGREQFVSVSRALSKRSYTRARAKVFCTSPRSEPTRNKRVIKDPLVS